MEIPIVVYFVFSILISCKSIDPDNHLKSTQYFVN